MTRAQRWTLLAASDGVDLVLTDFRMAEMNGLELLKEIKRSFPEASVVLMTAYATVENAVAAMKGGASDYLSKPFSLQEVEHVVNRALELKNLRAENRVLRAAVLEELPLIESRSVRMRALVDTARQAAASEATILLLGESGTGKNVLAREIHGWSPRSGHPFVVVNCTTLSEQLLESELFGHVRGSFTGAIKDKPGGWKPPMAAPSSLTRSRTCRCLCKPSCCVSSRSGALSGWEERRRSRSTPG